MANSKYCYVLVNKDTGKFLVEDTRLPIYWNKTVAQHRVNKFPGFIIEPVLLKELYKFILTYPY